MRYFASLNSDLDPIRGPAAAAQSNFMVRATSYLATSFWAHIQ